MNCSTYCLKCPNPQVTKANFSAHHGLCAEHNIGSTLSKCIHCGSIVPILSRPEKKPCTTCGGELESNYSRCMHLICGNCADYACPACNSICDYCGNKAQYLKHCEYNHLICIECLQQCNNLCPVCNMDNSDINKDYGKCEYCLKVSKIIEKECKHALCQNCDNENKSCPLCSKEKSVSKKKEKKQAMGVGISSDDVQIINVNEIKERKDSKEYQKSHKIDLDFQEEKAQPLDSMKIVKEERIEKKEERGKNLKLSQRDLDIEEEKTEGSGKVKIANEGYKEIAGDEQWKVESPPIVKPVPNKQEKNYRDVGEESEKDPLLPKVSCEITVEKTGQDKKSYQVKEKNKKNDDPGLISSIFLVVFYICIIGPLISLLIIAFCYDYSSEQLKRLQGTCSTILCLECCDPGSPAQNYWVKLILCKCSSKKRS